VYRVVFHLVGAAAQRHCQVFRVHREDLDCYANTGEK